MSFLSFLPFVGGVASGVGNVVSSLITSHSNEKNVENTNAQNYQIWQEQKDYQTAERLATQEYNDPKNQMARFKAAGLNPYLMLNQVDAGNTTAQTSPPSPTMEAYQQPTIPYGDLLLSAQLGL